MWTLEKQTHSMITTMLVNKKLSIPLRIMIDEDYTSEDLYKDINHCGHIAEEIMKDTESRFTG